MIEKLPDPVDEASRIEGALIDRRIAGIRQQAGKLSTNNPSGVCWSCDAETGTERRWCCIECRNAWEKDQ